MEQIIEKLTIAEQSAKSAHHRLDNLEKNQNTLEDKVDKLEINNAKMGEKIESLIEKLESLTSWIKALVMLGATSLVGFFFWYIQNLK